MRIMKLQSVRRDVRSGRCLLCGLLVPQLFSRVYFWAPGSGKVGWLNKNHQVVCVVSIVIIIIIIIIVVVVVVFVCVAVQLRGTWQY